MNIIDIMKTDMYVKFIKIAYEDTRVYCIHNLGINFKDNRNMYKTVFDLLSSRYSFFKCHTIRTEDGYFIMDCSICGKTLTIKI